MPAGFNRFAKTLGYVCLAPEVLVLQCHEKAASWRLVFSVVAAGPGVHVNNTVGRDHHVPGMANAIGEDRRAKASRQRQSTVVIRTQLRPAVLCQRRGWRWLLAGNQENNHADGDKDDDDDG